MQAVVSLKHESCAGAGVKSDGSAQIETDLCWKQKMSMKIDEELFESFALYLCHLQYMWI